MWNGLRSLLQTGFTVNFKLQTGKSWPLAAAAATQATDYTDLGSSSIITQPKNGDRDRNAKIEID